MKRVPVTIVTGFLGSGKSTLINSVLKSSKKKFGLLVNEFGDVSLESSIIQKNEEDEIIELSNGCMCCVMRDDIIDSIKKLIERSPDLDQIIIEASGLSDPIPIAQTILQDTLNGKIRLDAIIAVVDALNAEMSMNEFIVSVSQIKNADYIVITKSVEADKEVLDNLDLIIKTANPKAKKFKDNLRVPIDLMFDINIIDHSEIEEMVIKDNFNSTDLKEEKHECKGHNCNNKKSSKHGCKCNHEHDHKHDGCCKNQHEHSDEHHHDHKNLHEHAHGHKHEHNHIHDPTETLFFKSDKLISSKKFIQFMKNIDDGVFRIKGFMWSKNENFPNDKWIFQFVGKRKHLTPSEWKDGEKKQTAIVFIGKEFDKEKVLQGIKRCEIND